MADINPLDPNAAQLMDLSQQRKLADLLTQQGLQQPQGQMVSGQYVKASPLQYLANMANLYAGQKTGEAATQKATDYANALRAKSTEVQQSIMDRINAGDTKGALAIASQNPEYGGKEFVAPLLGNVIPKAPEIMSEKDKEDIRIKDAHNKLLEAHYKQIAAQQGQSLANSRVPMGYRMTPDGKGLEPIPGGPSDQKAQTVNVGRETVNTLATGLKDQYNLLKDTGGITSTKENALSNVPAYLSSSSLGQGTGKLFGTANQSARNTISQSRPLLLQAIAKATGMSSKQMDSNTELQMYLKAATDPSLDYEANIYALDQLQTLYGMGGAAPSSGGGIPSASDIDAEIARRRKK